MPSQSACARAASASCPQPRRAFAAASRAAAQLPLSTVDTYSGGIGRSVHVWYQL